MGKEKSSHIVISFFAVILGRIKNMAPKSAPTPGYGMSTKSEGWGTVVI